MSKSRIAQRRGFYAELPVSTIKEIDRRITPKIRKWQVIVSAISATKAKKRSK